MNLQVIRGRVRYVSSASTVKVSGGEQSSASASTEHKQTYEIDGKIIVHTSDEPAIIEAGDANRFKLYVN